MFSTKWLIFFLMINGYSSLCYNFLLFIVNIIAMFIAHQRVVLQLKQLTSWLGKSCFLDSWLLPAMNVPQLRFVDIEATIYGHVEWDSTARASSRSSFIRFSNIADRSRALRERRLIKNHGSTTLSGDYLAMPESILSECIRDTNIWDLKFSVFRVN